jgi:hypothetical protein
MLDDKPGGSPSSRADSFLSVCGLPTRCWMYSRSRLCKWIPLVPLMARSIAPTVGRSDVSAL